MRKERPSSGGTCRFEKSTPDASRTPPGGNETAISKVLFVGGDTQLSICKPSHTLAAESVLTMRWPDVRFSAAVASFGPRGCVRDDAAKLYGSQRSPRSQLLVGFLNDQSTPEFRHWPRRACLTAARSGVELVGRPAAVTSSAPCGRVRYNHRQRGLESAFSKASSSSGATH